jgi:hypothetical protein
VHATELDSRLGKGIRHCGRMRLHQIRGWAGVLGIAGACARIRFKVRQGH